MCGAQATTNVLLGKRYQVVSKEIKAYVQGRYGKAPGPVSEELKQLILPDGEAPITCRPADLLQPVYTAKQAEIGSIARTEEDVLTYIMFPQAGLEFLKRKYGLA